MGPVALPLPLRELLGGSLLPSGEDDIGLSGITKLQDCGTVATTELRWKESHSDPISLTSHATSRAILLIF